MKNKPLYSLFLIASFFILALQAQAEKLVDIKRLPPGWKISTSSHQLPASKSWVHNSKPKRTFSASLKDLKSDFYVNGSQKNHKTFYQESNGAATTKVLDGWKATELLGREGYAKTIALVFKDKKDGGVFEKASVSYYKIYHLKTADGKLLIVSYSYTQDGKKVDTHPNFVGLQTMLKALVITE